MSDFHHLKSTVQQPNSPKVNQRRPQRQPRAGRKQIAGLIRFGNGINFLNSSINIKIYLPNNLLKTNTKVFLCKFDYRARSAFFSVVFGPSRPPSTTGGADRRTLWIFGAVSLTGDARKKETASRVVSFWRGSSSPGLRLKDRQNQNQSRPFAAAQPTTTTTGCCNCWPWWVFLGPN